MFAVSGRQFSILAFCLRLQRLISKQGLWIFKCKMQNCGYKVIEAIINVKHLSTFHCCKRWAAVMMWVQDLYWSFFSKPVCECWWWSVDKQHNAYNKQFTSVPIQPAVFTAYKGWSSSMVFNTKTRTNVTDQW